METARCAALWKGVTQSDTCRASRNSRHGMRNGKHQRSQNVALSECHGKVLMDSVMESNTCATSWRGVTEINICLASWKKCHGKCRGRCDVMINAPSPTYRHPRRHPHTAVHTAPPTPSPTQCHPHSHPQRHPHTFTDIASPTHCQHIPSPTHRELHSITHTVTLTIMHVSLSHPLLLEHRHPRRSVTHTP